VRLRGGLVLQRPLGFSNRPHCSTLPLSNVHSRMPTGTKAGQVYMSGLVDALAEAAREGRRLARARSVMPPNIVPGNSHIPCKHLSCAECCSARMIRQSSPTKSPASLPLPCPDATKNELLRLGAHVGLITDELLQQSLTSVCISHTCSLDFLCQDQPA